MKKSSTIFIFFLILSLINLTDVRAECDAADSRCLLAQEFGLNQSQIPTSKEELSQFYLKERWTQSIEKNKILGPIHSLLKSFSWFFYILIHHSYEISLTFFALILIWFFIASVFAIGIETFSGLKGVYCFLLGILSAIILSWIPPNSAGVIEMLAQSILDFAFKQENWWMRLIIFLVIIILVALIIRAEKYATKYIKEQNKNKLTQKQEAQVKEVQAFTEELHGR